MKIFVRVSKASDEDSDKAKISNFLQIENKNLNVTLLLNGDPQVKDSSSFDFFEHDTSSKTYECDVYVSASVSIDHASLKVIMEQFKNPGTPFGHDIKVLSYEIEPLDCSDIPANSRGFRF